MALFIFWEYLTATATQQLCFFYWLFYSWRLLTHCSVLHPSYLTKSSRKWVISTYISPFKPWLMAVCLECFNEHVTVSRSFSSLSCEIKFFVTMTTQSGYANATVERQERKRLFLRQLKYYFPSDLFYLTLSNVFFYIKPWHPMKSWFDQSFCKFQLTICFESSSVDTYKRTWFESSLLAGLTDSQETWMGWTGALIGFSYFHTREYKCVRKGLRRVALFDCFLPLPPPPQSPSGPPEIFFSIQRVRA